MSRRLYENLFLKHSPEETFDLISDGILAFIANADRLCEDAQILFKQGRWASGRFLLAIADEEMAKPYIFLDVCRLDFSHHQKELLQLCDAFYDHVYKYAYYKVISNLNIQTIQDAMTEWLESVEKWVPYSENDDVKSIHETYFLLEIPLSIDFLDYDQRWSTPIEDVADYNYTMGAGISDSKATLELLKKTQRYGLFSSNTLRTINEYFKKHLISEITDDEILSSLHEKVATDIEQNLKIPVIAYKESSLHAIPLYHFLPMQRQFFCLKRYRNKCIHRKKSALIPSVKHFRATCV